MNPDASLLQGQYFSGNDHRVYLLGNPVIWWGNLVLLAAFLGAFALNALRDQRRAGELIQPEEEDQARRYL